MKCVHCPGQHRLVMNQFSDTLKTARMIREEHVECMSPDAMIPRFEFSPLLLKVNSSFAFGVMNSVEDWYSKPSAKKKSKIEGGFQMHRQCRRQQVAPCYLALELSR